MCPNPNPNPNPRAMSPSLHGIFKAAWAAWLGDNIRVLDRDAKMKDRLIESGPAGPKSTPFPRELQASVENAEDPMNVEVDSPHSTTTTYNQYTTPDPLWVRLIPLYVLAILAVLLFYTFKPQPSPTPTPIPTPTPTPQLDIGVTDGPVAWKPM